MSGLVIPVILCGGAGKRLWPLSRKNHPKPLLKLFHANSLLQQTITRTLQCEPCIADDIVLVTTRDLKAKIEAQSHDVSPFILTEPEARNTAAAIAYASGHIYKNIGEDAIIWIIPSDHIIHDVNALNIAVKNAAQIADKGYIATFGIRPDHAETGYGYIEKGVTLNGAGYTVKHFHEKPDMQTAQHYITQKTYLWNSGMFVFKASDIKDSYRKFAPCYMPLFEDNTQDYRSLPSLPFDKAIMEKTDHAAVIECDPGWADIGTWKNLARHKFLARRKQSA